MPGPASARRFAQAVFQIALERDELDAWLDDLSLMAASTEHDGFSELLDAPQVPLLQKLELIRNTLGDSVTPLAANLLSLLASRNLAHALPGVVDVYQQLLDEHRGIERAEVLSAVPLTDAETGRIQRLLEGVGGKQIKMTSRVEPGILGGLVARVGDKVIDGSTRTRLQAMRRGLAERL